MKLKEQTPVTELVSPKVLPMIVNNKKYKP